MHFSPMNMQWIGWFFSGTFTDLGRFWLPAIIMGGSVFRFLAGGPLDISLIDPMHVSDSMVPAIVVEEIHPDGWKPSAVALFQSVDGWKPVMPSHGCPCCETTVGLCICTYAAK